MPKTTEQLEKLKEERKNLILESSMIVFYKQSYKNTSVDDICKKARISHGLFYHYFKSKKDVHNYVYIYGKERFNDIYSIFNNENINGLNFIKILVTETISRLKKDQLFPYFFAITINDILNTNSSNGSVDIYKERILKEIIKGQIDGDISSGEPIELANLLLSSILGLTILKIKNGHNYVIPDENLLINLFCKKGK